MYQDKRVISSVEIINKMSRNSFDQDEIDTPCFRRRAEEIFQHEKDSSYVRIEEWLNSREIYLSDVSEGKVSLFTEESIRSSFDLTKNPLYKKRKESKTISAE